MTELRKEFRRFALGLYGSVGVSQAALLLQDRCGVDVNVLLLAAFVGAVRGSSLSTSDFEAARDRTRQWQSEVVGPLRTLRQRLKDGPPPGPNPTTADLRDRVKALELDAELIEMDELADFLDQLAAPPAPDTAGDRATAAIRLVVQGSAARELNDEEHAAVTVIASAATRQGVTR
jgi:uncharacterized protein (TIGR02444 family)